MLLRWLAVQRRRRPAPKCSARTLRSGLCQNSKATCPHHNPTASSPATAATHPEQAADAERRRRRDLRTRGFASLDEADLVDTADEASARGMPLTEARARAADADSRAEMRAAMLAADQISDKAVLAAVAGGLPQCRHLFDGSVLGGLVGLWVVEFVTELHANVGYVDLAHYARDARQALDGLSDGYEHLRGDVDEARDIIHQNRHNAASSVDVGLSEGLHAAGDALWPLAETHDPAVDQLRVWFGTLIEALRRGVGRRELIGAVQAARSVGG